MMIIINATHVLIHTQHFANLVVAIVQLQAAVTHICTQTCIDHMRMEGNVSSRGPALVYVGRMQLAGLTRGS